MRQDRTVEEEREKASERACVRLWKIDCGCNVVNVRRKDRSSDEKKKGGERESSGGEGKYLYSGGLATVHACKLQVCIDQADGDDDTVFIWVISSYVYCLHAGPPSRRRPGCWLPA